MYYDGIVVLKEHKEANNSEVEDKSYMVLVQHL